MADIISQLGGFGYALVFFVIALSIIVAVHEYGHYIVGRWCGIHAEVFSLGFGPVIYSRVDKHGTKWQLASLPFGGYVKFLGDANAASVGDDGQVAEADRRRTMLGAPLWARALTVAAGPVFNFVLSAIIFFCIMMLQGRAADPIRIAEILDLPSEYESGLEAGDEILKIGGVETPSFDGLSDIFDAVPFEQVVDYTVLRDGSEITVSGPYPSTSRVNGMTPGSASQEAGLLVGDVLTHIDDVPVFAFSQLIDAVTEAEGDELAVSVWREGETLEFVLAPREIDLLQDDGTIEVRWLIGISSGLFFEPATETPGVGEALTSASGQVTQIISTSLTGLYHMIAGSMSTCNLSSPVGIGQASGAMAEQGATSFIWFVAVLSTAVGLLNLFPIPVLDGGHLVFYAYEAVTRRPPSDGALKVMMATGLSLILGLMLFALANDLFLCP